MTCYILTTFFKLLSAYTKKKKKFLSTNTLITLHSVLQITKIKCAK